MNPELRQLEDGSDLSDDLAVVGFRPALKLAFAAVGNIAVGKVDVGGFGGGGDHVVFLSSMK
jgi:hypothetical protein